jgi:ankyrin repeat protein
MKKKTVALLFVLVMLFAFFGVAGKTDAAMSAAELSDFFEFYMTATPAEIEKAIKRLEPEDVRTLSRFLLLSACETGTPETLKRTFNILGADARTILRVFASDKEYPLMAAVFSNPYPESVEFLLQNGADPNAKSSKGIPVLGFAIGRSAALNNGNRDTSLKIASLLLKYGADVNAKAGNGTLLFGAVKIDDQAMVSLFLKNGANVNAKLDDGRTILEFAKKAGANDEIIKMLKDAGAK